MLVLIKLSTGEEITGEIKKTKKRNVTTLLYPLKIIYRQSMDGMPVTFVARYGMFSKKHFVEINNNHIISISEARESFHSYYKDAVKHYETLDSNIDKQLGQLSNDKSDMFENILQNMPKDSPIN